MSSSAALRFSYFSDPLCIWAFVAQPKLDRLLSAHGDQLAVSYHVVPVFGSVRWRFEHGPWASEGVEGRIQKTAEVAARFGHPEVTGRGWSVVRHTSSWAPGAAIEAVAVSEREGALAAGCTGLYQHALRSAFFVDDRDIGARGTQLEVAEQCGIATAPIEDALDDGRALAALWEDQHAGERIGVQGSPTYVFDGGRAMLYGNFSEGVLQATVVELLSHPAPGGSECP